MLIKISVLNLLHNWHLVLGGQAIKFYLLKKLFSTYILTLVKALLLTEMAELPEKNSTNLTISITWSWLLEVIFFSTKFSWTTVHSEIGLRKRPRSGIQYSKSLLRFDENIPRPRSIIVYLHWLGGTDAPCWTPPLIWSCYGIFYGKVKGFQWIQ